ncbi:MAG: SpoVR family protein [Betaproteobacteria bacterium]|nr:MAG: SpoVR family protein [Betaproteobacteria bacterium]
MTKPKDAGGGGGTAAPERPWPKLLTRPSLPLPTPARPRAAEPIARGSEWTGEALERFDAALARQAQRLGLSVYPIQYELITAEQMIDLISTVGMPVHYPHWAFGKHLVAQERTYRKGQSGLAYEIVINTNPSLVYLMETNTLALQVLVMAHAAYGHNAFFKNNYLFQQFTQADSILDYLKFARDYVMQCEQTHGWREVEKVLDCCHTLAPYGVDRYRKPGRLSARRERERQAERLRFAERHFNPDFAHLNSRRDETAPQTPAFEPQENILYFIEKHAPRLAPWQRELVRIVRKVSQYFYPQRLTKVANEGAATFWHYTLLHELYDAGEVDDGFMLEWLSNHTDVVTQPPFDAKHYRGLNPYALGFAIYRDIRRICEAPTDEDREWFPELCGRSWPEAIHFAMANFKDESLIEQYLSPKVMRDMRLFLLHDGPEDKNNYEVRAIHNEQGYLRLRQALAAQYRAETHVPQIEVARAGDDTERALLLHHRVLDGRLLDSDGVDAVLAHVKELWGFDVVLEEVDATGSRLKVHRV